MHTQLCVLGAGPGGYAAAFLAADLGLQVTLIDREPSLGGVCLLRGCIPSKALLHLSKTMSEARHLADWGIAFAAPTIDLVERRAVASQEYAARVASRERDEHPERSAEYREYLDGPQWRERRELVMARAGQTCEGCRKHHAENVHHLTYAHIQHEFLFELVALCRDCHERWHRVGRYAEWEESA